MMKKSRSSQTGFFFFFLKPENKLKGFRKYDTSVAFCLFHVPGEAEEVTKLSVCEIPSISAPITREEKQTLRLAASLGPENKSWGDDSGFLLLEDVHDFSL